MNLLNKILSRLRDENKAIQIKVQPQENDYITLSFYLNYQQRIQLIDSIENKAEIPAEFLFTFAEAIRNKTLNRDSWAADDLKYWNEVYRRMEDIKPLPSAL